MESIATNDMVAAELRKAGFDGVVVTGNGANRDAVGRWPKETQKVELPKQVVAAKEI